MDFIISIFNTFLYQPLFNILILLYEYLPGRDFGIAVIVLTVLIKFLLYPLGAKTIKSQKALSELQPKVKEVQEKYKDDKEKQAKEMMALYRREKINPFSGFFLLFIQLPVLIALYRVFWQGLKPEQMTFLYSFVPSPGLINPTFLGIINISQFFQVKMSSMKSKSSAGKKKSDFSQIMQKQMQYFFPIFTVLILFKLPSAIGLYWLATTLFTIIQQYFFFRRQKTPNI